MNNQGNKAIALKMEEMASRINPTEFKFYSDGAAWKFQLGITLRWCLIGLLVAVSIGVAIWYFSMVHDVDRARTIIDASDNVSELLKRARRNSDGSYFIDFTAAKKDSIRQFTEYQRLNSRTVRVYLGRDIRTSKP